MPAQDHLKLWQAYLETAAATKRHLAFPPAPPAAQAFTALALRHAHDRPILWIVPDDEALVTALRDLHALEPATDPCCLSFPPTYRTGTDPRNGDMDGTGARLQTLHRIAELREAGQAPIIITTSTALSQPTLSPTQIRHLSRKLEVGQAISITTIITFLAESGYDREAEVLEKGQYAGRGGILDVWPPDSDFPLRLEWFGNELESLRHFDPVTQRTIEKTATLLLSPLDDSEGVASGLAAHIPTLAAVIWHDYQLACETIQAHDAPTTPDPACLLAPAVDFLVVDFGGVTPDLSLPAFESLHQAVRLPATSGTAQLAEARRRFLDDLQEHANKGWHVLFHFDTQGTREHFTRHVLQKRNPRFEMETGCLSEGFRCPAVQCLFVAEADLYGRKRFVGQTDNTAKRARRYTGSRINDFTDMEEGDLVVHTEHGVGRYLGVQSITFNNRIEEVLAIAYADDAKLYVPVTHAHLLSRYVGMAGSAAGLHRLGGKRWSREKDAAQSAVMDLAAELLEIQARRNLLQGHPFPQDNPLQHEFDQAFPFVETPDQLQVITEVKEDMQAPRPMDRLICGDAGYGKTEVAMRAAFKAVQDRMQVAVLVPTTVLAQQHYQTFSERMAGFDLRIAVISRFQTLGQRKRILAELQHGGVDIIIGTHALVQPGVRFANLGLVIIDEEQRFGVAHKERLKTLRALVDVLTLSATPIPRTLYMSMTGARDLSLLRTAPRERLPIETIVTTATDETIVQAIRFEHGRGGQTYFLHNRVISIARLREKLSALVPEVRIEMAHGRMHAAELSGVMQRFVAGQIDVLLCTTIIESGVDIPRANTIIIDRADRFGIADLYQLRGRVGRGDRRGYAYLLLPRHGIVDKSARERIQAVRRHGGLGAGFNLAIKDMEIRGAGNILGAAQSGHISAVGFGLYCQLLQRAVARMQGLPVPEIDTELRLDFIVSSDSASAHEKAPACIPIAYIMDERLRIALYRRIAEATEARTLDDLQTELLDRFGPIPDPVLRLIQIARIRCQAAAARITMVETRGQRLLLFREADPLTCHNHQLPRLRSSHPDVKLQEIEAYLGTLTESNT